MLYPRPPTDEYIMLQLQSVLSYVRQMTFSLCYIQDLTDEKYYGHHSPTEDGFLKLDPILQQMNTGAR
jgi:hypothetical protein